MGIKVGEEPRPVDSYGLSARSTAESINFRSGGNPDISSRLEVFENFLISIVCIFGSNVC